MLYLRVVRQDHWLPLSAACKDEAHAAQVLAAWLLGAGWEELPAGYEVEREDVGQAESPSAIRYPF